MDFLLLSVAALTLVVVAIMAFKLRARFQHMDKQFKSLSRYTHLELRSQLDEKTREIQNALSIQQLGFRFPLFLGGWSIDSFLGKFLIQTLMENPPKTIVELGSGSSTLLIARCMQLLGRNDFRHIAVDHEERYLNLTRQFLALNELEDRIEFWICPLRHMEEIDKLWYGDLLGRLGETKIDLLLVDGPPGFLQIESRLPALPLLLPYLNEHCVIILDDAGRRDERSIAKNWSSNYPEFTVEFIKEGHGVAILQRNMALKD